MRANVLVVEDHVDLAENLAELFEDAGATVRVCGSADEALSVAHAEGYDLAIVDLRLPAGMSGVDLVPRLQQAAPQGEVILMTGNATLDTAIAAVRHGVFAYIQKPFDPEDLLALGERALVQVTLRHEREGLARELASSEALYRGVVDTVEALIVGLDDRGHVEFINRFAADAMGWSSRTVGARPFEEIAADEPARPRLRRMLTRAKGGKTVREEELEVLGPDGAVRRVRWTIAPLAAESRSAPPLLAVGIDITDRVELERRTAEAEAMAAMGALTTGLAHEIRNPLNAAKLQLELLERLARRSEDQILATRMVERVDIVRDEIGRLSIMLDDFLSLARPRGIEHHPFPMLPLVEEVVFLMAPLAMEAGVQLQVRCQGLRSLLASGDRAKVKQVLVNLVSNAIEAMRGQDGGRIIVAQREEGADWIEVVVADTGPGMPAEMADQIFQPFFTTKEAGTGLGLNVVKRIVEMHGGVVTLGSAASFIADDPGIRGVPHGTVARFTLPRAHDPAAEPGVASR